VGAELFHANRQTDMKLIVAFPNFANAPKNNNINNEDKNKKIYSMNGNQNENDLSNIQKFWAVTPR
jgi:hypothetical protein